MGKWDLDKYENRLITADLEAEIMDMTGYICRNRADIVRLFQREGYFIKWQDIFNSQGKRLYMVEKFKKAQPSQPPQPKPQPKKKVRRIEPKDFYSNLKPISYRYNEEVLDKLNRVWDGNKMFTKTAVLNTLLNEILDKYLEG